MADLRDSFLHEFHARYPGITARVFERARTSEGGTPYDLLAVLPTPGQRVLDLGCGDGPLLANLRRRGHSAESLVGVDASLSELAAAGRRPELDDVDLLCERGEALSLADESFDVVVSHLAFMLFSEPAACLREIARVLRPGGVFATVVGGGPVVPVPDGTPQQPDAFALFPALARDDLKKAATPAPRLGDPRTYTAEGLRELLPETMSNDVSERRVEVICDGPFDDVWLVVTSSYEATALSEEPLSRLREALQKNAARNDDGTYRCRLAVRALTAHRKS